MTPEEERSIDEPDIPERLRAARYVAISKAEKGEEGLIKYYRDMHERSPKSFDESWRAMEKDLLLSKKAGIGSAPGSEVAVNDIGAEAALDIIDGLIKEFHEVDSQKPR